RLRHPPRAAATAAGRAARTPATPTRATSSEGAPMGTARSDGGSGELALDPRAMGALGARTPLWSRALAPTRSHPWTVVCILAGAGLLMRMLLVRGIWVDEAIGV